MSAARCIAFSAVGAWRGCFAWRGCLCVWLAVLLLAGCTSTPPSHKPAPTKPAPTHPPERTASAHGADIVIFALGLVETGYRFGGKNPEAGLDCSGMVSYVYRQAAGITLSGSAADIGKKGRIISRSALRPGDLVFFNTMGRPYSHVGIYMGGGRFVHAPNSRGKVRTESFESGWFASRFHEARTYFSD